MGKAIKNSNLGAFLDVLTREAEGSQLDGYPLLIKQSPFRLNLIGVRREKHQRNIPFGIPKRKENKSDS